MVNKQEITADNNLTSSPSWHLDVSISQSNREVLKTMKLMMTKHDIMKEAGDDGAMMKLSARGRLDHLAQVKNYSYLVNSEEAMSSFKNQLTKLALSVATIQEFDKTATAKKKVDSINIFLSLAPTALVKLSEKNDDVSKLKKLEICCLLFACYGVMVDDKKLSKPTLVNMLVAKIKEKPEAVGATAALLVPVTAAPHASSSKLVTDTVGIEELFI
jgi:hypothetical protein